MLSTLAIAAPIQERCKRREINRRGHSNFGMLQDSKMARYDRGATG
ncbi:hypothetical protein L284_09655 [Novosphingobium lindaniclasticum LE124]|uniref:Uncharacterized protein n=1 Tax=Novosphingobium lindaniclasticum LE124 TaxID=1096930 RepID=T0IWX9_9SPHN|nr:hypothetical protein L284_09655 [Novosphingobium lindaniclasticum LE124]